MTDTPYSPLGWLKLSLNVLLEVSEANFTVLFPYLHTILHFCLLYLNDTKHPLAVEIRRLFDTVLSSFVVPVKFPADAQLWFSLSDASTALPVGNLIKQIKEQL